MKTRIWMFIAVVAGIAGVYYLGVTLSYLISYYSEPHNPSRHEYLEGVVIAAMITLPFWLASSASMYQVRARVPRYLYLGVNSVSAILFVLFVAVNMYPVIMFVMGK